MPLVSKVNMWGYNPLYAQHMEAMCTAQGPYTVTTEKQLHYIVS